MQYIRLDGQKSNILQNHTLNTLVAPTDHIFTLKCYADQRGKQFTTANLSSVCLNRKVICLKFAL